MGGHKRGSAFKTPPFPPTPPPTVTAFPSYSGLSAGAPVVSASRTGQSLALAIFCDLADVTLQLRVVSPPSFYLGFGLCNDAGVCYYEPLSMLA